MDMNEHCLETNRNAKTLTDETNCQLALSKGNEINCKFKWIKIEPEQSVFMSFEKAAYPVKNYVEYLDVTEHFVNIKNDESGIQTEINELNSQVLKINADSGIKTQSNEPFSQTLKVDDDSGIHSETNELNELNSQVVKDEAVNAENIYQHNQNIKQANDEFLIHSTFGEDKSDTTINVQDCLVNCVKYEPDETSDAVNFTENEISIISSNKSAQSLSSELSCKKVNKLAKNKKRYKCSHCEKSFFHHELQYHKMTHLAEISHNCLECQHFFRSILNLKQHYLMHQGFKKCSQCDKFLVDFESLSIHIGGHAYSECGKRFVHNNDLQDHKMTLMVKRHKCLECGKCFRYKDALHDHQMTHSGEKPHKSSKKT